VKRLLITGGSSYLGQHLIPEATKQYECLYTYFSQDPLGLPQAVWLDVRDKEDVANLVHEWHPDIIIHAAGSNRSEDMVEVICRGAENVTAAAIGTGIRLIHISSDVIFDGTQAPYHENDLPNPIHEYGKAKEEAEKTVSDHGNHVIIRTSLIYGLKIMDLSTRWIADALDKGESVTLFSDQIRNPVWVQTLCGASLELAELDFRGILNIAGRQPMSRAELGIKMLDWWGIEGRETLFTGLSDSRWPADCRLDVTLAANLLNTPMLGVDEVLDEKR
jgi:dTDP-4-dehydrorhamnose reductase